MADGGGLLPLGGVEESGGYKGSGLSTMVEILTGVLGGAKFGSNNRDWRTAGPEEYADLVSKMTHYIIFQTTVKPHPEAHMDMILLKCF